MKQVLRYFKPYVHYIFLVIAVLFGNAICELALPKYMANIIDKGIVTGDIQYIYKTGAVMLGITAIAVTFSLTNSFIASRTASFAMRDVRSALFKKVVGFSAKEMDKFQSSSLITRTTNDIQTVQQTSIMVIRMAFFAPVMGFGSLIMALRTSPGLTWTIAISILAIFLIIIVLILLVMKKFAVLQELLDKMNQVVGERLSGLLVVRAFNSEKFEEERFDKTNKDLTKIGIFVNKAMSLMFPALFLIMDLSCILIVWFGAKMVDAQTLMVGDILAFLQYSMHVIISFLVITAMFIMIPRAIVSANRIGEVLSVESSIADSENPSHINNCKGVIEFKNVSFAYPDAEEKTLKDISFTAYPGQTTAVIGSTGSGKTSLVTLIPRFFDVTEGEITIDGINVKDVALGDLRDSIGYVPQKGLLFSGTIASNLKFGKKDASEEEMIEALTTAQAIDFVNEMPDKFETEIAQGGTSVSGGQKQRLAIARALMKKPKIYIFDDSFSALDFKTDTKLRAALKEKVAESTFIIVAQRINTILDADKIIVLDEGKIVGMGTHSQLLASNEIYQEIAHSQLSEEELAKGGAH